MAGDADKVVVVVAPGEHAAALRWLSVGAAVVVAGDDAGSVGEAVAALQGAGRVAGYVGGTGDDALDEMIAELFPGSERRGG